MNPLRRFSTSLNLSGAASRASTAPPTTTTSTFPVPSLVRSQFRLALVMSAEPGIRKILITICLHVIIVSAIETFALFCIGYISDCRPTIKRHNTEYYPTFTLSYDGFVDESVIHFLLHRQYKD
jgi:hypothetical protein